MRNDMAYILLSRQQIKQKVEQLGKTITETYRGKNPLMICVLKGSIVFFADLIREIDTPVEVETMTASSYGAATVSSGVVSVVSKLDEKIRDRDVILVEDIIDSGRTIAFIKEDMLKKGVRSLKVCALLDKPSRRVADIKPDYLGFEVPDAFVVGYGLDYDQKYRNFPEIGVLKPEIYEK
ncbi:MAG: hypoxanthine phosphoribosyltransferase [Clostridia bacterium]|nr:hypoxanthine phosphoribosyltransferase [Clostridia bacterium]MBQ9409074.1 hypoxanthine phosphoribosyltransferase [Clostridia bacterium]